MDNLNFVSKKLVAEYKYREGTKFETVERAYKAGEDKYIIEYAGGQYSMYSVAKNFFECQARKGVYELNKNDFEMWYKMRKSEGLGQFLEYPLEQNEELEFEIEDYIKKQILKEHEEVMQAIDDKDLPF